MQLLSQLYQYNICRFRFSNGLPYWTLRFLIFQPIKLMSPSQSIRCTSCRFSWPPARQTAARSLLSLSGQQCYARFAGFSRGSIHIQGYLRSSANLRSSTSLSPLNRLIRTQPSCLPLSWGDPEQTYPYKPLGEGGQKLFKAYPAAVELLGHRRNCLIDDSVFLVKTKSLGSAHNIQKIAFSALVCVEVEESEEESDFLDGEDGVVGDDVLGEDGLLLAFDEFLIAHGFLKWIRASIKIKDCMRPILGKIKYLQSPVGQPVGWVREFMFCQQIANIKLSSEAMLQKYKFSINNLALVNSNYPFDFYLRIKEPSNCAYQDSPTISAHTCECDQNFPWEFAVSSLDITVEFIENSGKGKTQIVKAIFAVEGLTEDYGEQVIMLANRTGKKLCVLDFSFVPMPPERFLIEEGLMNQQQDQSPRQKVVMSKDEHKKLEKQIQKLNRSIEKILDHQRSEHAMFSRYLQQSTSFLQEMMNESRQKISQSFRSPRSPESGRQRSDSQRKLAQEEQRGPKISNFAIEQVLRPLENESGEEDAEDLSKKWYYAKFDKERPPFREVLPNNKKEGIKDELSLEYSEDSLNSRKRILLEQISFETNFLPSEISFFSFFHAEDNGEAQPQNEPLLRMKFKNEGSFNVQEKVDLPERQSYLVSIKDSKQHNQLSGCMAIRQLQSERMYLYDEHGDQQGLMKFKAIKASKQPKEQIAINSGLFGQSEPRGNEQPNAQQGEVEQPIAESERPSAAQMKPSIQEGQRTNRDGARPRRTLLPQIKKCELVSNSISFSFLPNIVRQRPSFSVRPKRQHFLSDQDPSESTSFRINPSKKDTSHLITLRIDTINVQISDDFDHFVGKFVKLSMKDRRTYATEAISLSKNLKWKGSEFIFEKVSEFAQLKIELCIDDNGECIVEGTAEICLALLFLNRPNSIQFCHEYLRDSSQSIVGELVIGYENVVHNKARSLSNKKDLAKPQTQLADIMPVVSAPKRKRKNTKKSDLGRNIVSDSNPPNKRLQKILKGNKGSQRDHYDSSNLIKAKKYTGGNVIIGRAPRFRRQHQFTEPGPGDYQSHSGFERYGL